MVTVVSGYAGLRKPAVYGHPAYRHAGQELDGVRLAKDSYMSATLTLAEYVFVSCVLSLTVRVFK